MPPAWPGILAAGAALLCIAWAGQGALAGASAVVPADEAVAALTLYLAEPPAEQAAPRLVAQTRKQPASREGKLIIIDPDAPAAPAEAPTATDENGDPVIRFDQPITVGAVPILGHSIAELIAGQPLYPPIEGLDPKFWKDKHCSDCHQWTKDRICEQAKTYVGTGENMIFRLSHPYGAPFKVALERWAKAGCL